MADLLIVFASLNQVSLLKRTLYRRGVFVEMQRTPHCLAKTGCGFALRAQPDQLTIIEQEAAALEIVNGGLFQVNAEGQWSPYSPTANQDPLP